MVSPSPAPALRSRPAPYKVPSRLDQPLRGFGRTFEERVNPGPSAAMPLLALEPLEPTVFTDTDWNVKSEEESIHKPIFAIPSRLDQPLRGFGRTFEERVLPSAAAPPLLALEPLEPVFFADAEWDVSHLKSEEESIHTPIFPNTSRLDQPLRGFGRTFEERVIPSAAAPPLLALEPLEPVFFAEADWDVSDDDLKSEEESSDASVSARLEQPFRRFGRTFKERAMQPVAPHLLALKPLQPIVFADADWDVSYLKSEEESTHKPIFPISSRLDQPLRGFGRTFEERVNPSPARVPVQPSSMDTDAFPVQNVWGANEAERASPATTRLSRLRRARKRAARRAEDAFYGGGRSHTP